MTAAASSGPVVPTWTFADRLRKIRRDVVDMEQAEFAEALGARRPAYSAWEAGRNQPRDLVAFARRVELLTGVPAAWVLGLDVAVSAAPAVPAGRAVPATDGGQPDEGSRTTRRRQAANAEKSSLCTSRAQARSAPRWRSGSAGHPGSPFGLRPVA